MIETIGEKALIEELNAFISLIDRSKQRYPEGYYYKSMHHFIKENARLYKSQPFTQEEKYYVSEIVNKLGFKPKVKECYYNAQMLMLDSKKRISYVEGYAHSLISTMHGWNVINGKVIDLTWNDDKGKHVFGEFNEEKAYFGIQFSNEYVRENMIKTKMASSLIDDYKRRWPLLKKKFITL